MIKHPLVALKISRKFVLFFIALTWIYSLACILSQLLVEHSFALEGFLTSCSFNYISRSTPHRLANMVLFVFGFCVPVSIMIVFYIKLWYFLTNKSMHHKDDSIKSRSWRDHEKLLSKKPTPDVDKMKRLYSKQSEASANSEIEDSKFIKRELKVTRTIIFIMFAFLFAWTPYAAITLFAQYAPEGIVRIVVTPFTASLPALFAKLSSVYNPVLYTLTNKECRNYYRSVLFKSDKKNASESMNLAHDRSIIKRITKN